MKGKNKLIFRLLFPQVSSLHLLQVFIILQSSIMLEEITRENCCCSRTVNWWSWPMITAQAQTELITEETQHSCSCSQETRCMCVWLQTHMFGEPTTIQPSVVFWSLKCENRCISCESIHFCVKMDVNIWYHYIHISLPMYFEIWWNKAVADKIKSLKIKFF